MHRKELAKVAYKNEFFLHSTIQNVTEFMENMENLPKTKRTQKMNTKRKIKKLKNEKKIEIFKNWKKKSEILKNEKKIKNFENFKIFWFFVTLQKIGHFWKNLKFWKKIENLKKFEIFEKKLKSVIDFSDSISYTLYSGEWRGNGQNTTIPRTEVRVWDDRMASFVITAPHCDPS